MSVWKIPQLKKLYLWGQHVQANKCWRFLAQNLVRATIILYLFVLFTFSSSATTFCFVFILNRMWYPSDTHLLGHPFKDVLTRWLAVACIPFQRRRPPLRRHSRLSPMDRHHHVLLPRPTEGWMDSQICFHPPHQLIPVGTRKKDHRLGEITHRRKHGSFDKIG